jgi:malonate transporter and related proteins
MSLVLASLFPVIALIGLGFFLKRSLIAKDDHWTGIERLAYYVLFPALIVETLARADLASVPLAGIGGALFTSVCIMCLSLFAAAGTLKRVMAVALYGRPGVTAASVAMIAMIPVLNVFAVLALARHGAGTPPSLAATLRQLATNPLIVACALGIGLNLTGLPVPAPVYALAETLGRASLALGLLLVGAGLVIEARTRPGPALWLSTGLKLIVMPAMALTLAMLLGVRGAELAVVAICSAVPTASNAYILARQLGGDAPLMAQIITVQTLLSALTLPLALLMAEWIG